VNLTKEQAAEVMRTADYQHWSDALELPGGYTVRAKIEPDCDSNLEDSGDWYGRIEWDRTPRYNTQPQRPASMNGAARKIQTRDGATWWQPPADVVKDADSLAKLEARVRGYFGEQWSYVGVVLEVRYPACKECGERKVDHASLWGIESDAGDYFAETLVDLSYELLKGV